MNRLRILICAVCCLVGLSELFAGPPVDVWLGTSARKPSRGIYHCTLDPDRGVLSDPTLAAEIKGPGFLAMHPDQPVLYAVGTLDKPVVAAYRVTGTGQSASLKLLNSVAIGDGGACHVSVNKAGTMLLTAQYGTGSVAAFSLRSDGSVNERTVLIEHQGGSNVVPGRQTSPHAHWTGFSADERFAFVPDLGLDQVVTYRVDSESATIAPHGAADLRPGAGPRHMKFHQNGKWAYVLHELDLAVTVFDYDAAIGSLQAKQTIETVPRAELDQLKFKSCSEIRVHPSGKFVYAANRGHDTVTAFRVNQEDGTLTFIERENVRGATPRNFNIDPSGRWLLAGGQDSHTLASFEINPETGELVYNRSIVHAPSCICVLFAP